MTPIPILDTHQHLIYADRWPYAWTNGIPALAGKSFTLDDYMAAIDGTGIAAPRFMETSPDDPHWREETLFAAELARTPGSIVRGIVANCRPECNDFVAWLRASPRCRLPGCGASCTRCRTAFRRTTAS